MGRKKPKFEVAVFDCETDPFEAGSEIAPFAIGFYDGARYLEGWGPQCVESFLAFLETEAPLVLYAHNGGKFDFLFLAEHLRNPLKIINGRIVKARIGEHELRDSFAIMPVPLAAHDKGTIDYALFHRDRRDAHRADILEYLARDCESLYALVTAFNDRFGRKLTVASTAMQQLRKHHEFITLGPSHDARFRPYYFGGRCQHFETGKLAGDWKVYDVNSMYPFVMKAFDHPIGPEYVWTRDLDAALAQDKPFFARVSGINHQGLPVRVSSGLTFEQTDGEFWTCSHELAPAIRSGRFVVKSVHEILIPETTIRFDAFVDAFVADKLAAEAAGDKAGRIFAKLMLNSAYGKFAQNPEDFKDWHIRHRGEPLPRDPWELYEDAGEWDIWRKPNPGAWGYFDCAVAASITSAARSVLLDALLAARRPVYCDTDSIICESLPLDLDQSRLGAWKLEAQGDTLHIAGKKLYALYDGAKCVKHASKGVRVAPEVIARVAAGEDYLWKSEAPSISLIGSQRFIERKITRTKNAVRQF
jgi:hypothetical protein